MTVVLDVKMVGDYATSSSLSSAHRSKGRGGGVKGSSRTARVGGEKEGWLPWRQDLRAHPHQQVVVLKLFGSSQVHRQLQSVVSGLQGRERVLPFYPHPPPPIIIVVFYISKISTV